MGITVSMCNEQRIPESMFLINGDANAFYDYYVEDEILYAIVIGADGWKAEEKGKAEPVYYAMDRIERNVYNTNGTWVGICYYEVPYIVTYPETDAEAARMIRADMGSFVNEVADTFEEIVLLLEGDIGYASDDDFAAKDGSRGVPCRCYVDTEITHSNENILEITYHYNINLWRILEEGEAVARYDLNEGIALEHQDWQSGILEQMEAYLKELKANK